MEKLDLFAIRDEKTVLNNPHKGWYWHYIDQGYSRPGYRDDAELIGNVSEFPGLHQIYLRFDWVDINPKKGIFDFSYLDEIMDCWGSRGYTFSLRMATFETERKRWGLNQRATPEYVIEAGARGVEYNVYDYEDPNLHYLPTAWEPDYGDPIFLGYAEEAMMRLGEKYNHDNRIESVDIGTFGRYGEGHTSLRIFEEDVLRQHIDITRNAFPDKLVFVNDDLIYQNVNCVESLTAYCLDRGIGLRDDSICVAGWAKNSQAYDTMRNTKIYDSFKATHPIDIEFAHASLIPEDVWRGGFPAMEALRRSGATYAGFHDYPGRFLKNNPWFAEYAANRLGYWYRPDMFEMDCNGGRITVTNLGWALSYRDYALYLYLQTENGIEYNIGRIAGSAGWTAQMSSVSEFRFEKPLEHGVYHILIALYDEYGKSIKMALKQSCMSDGKYRIGTIRL